MCEVLQSDNSAITAMPQLTEASDWLLIQKKESISSEYRENINLKLNHNKVRMQYGSWKKSVVDLNLKLQFLSALDSDNRVSLEDAAAKLKEKKQNVANLKNELCTLEGEFEEMADQAQSLYEELQEESKLLEETTQVHNTKKSELENEIKEILSYGEIVTKAKEKLAAADTTNVPETLAAVIQLHTQLTENIEQNRKNLELLEPEIETMKTTVSALEEQYRAVHEQLTDGRRMMHTLRQQQQHTQQDTQGQCLWISNLVELTKKLSGIQVKEIQGDCVVLTIDDGSTKCGRSIELSVTYHNQAGLGVYVLQDAQVNISTVDVRELVKHAVRTDDVAYLARGVQRLWQGHHDLLVEMEQIQERFAVDWVYKERQVRMLSANAQTICTLRYNEGYPVTGSVQLEAAIGLPSGLTLENIQESVKYTSITQWVEFLHEKFDVKRVNVDMM